ncbi:MAG: hypothetical protein ABW100_13160 [Candidatus Thiodiazotropha sp. 6PLUC3]
MQKLQESRLMSITHREFSRSLAPLKRHYMLQEEEQGRAIFLHSESFSVEIRLGSENAFSIGALSMPRTQVDFIFHAASVEEKALFLKRFELCFRRGGG